MWQQLASTARPWRRPMLGRDRDEPGRASTPLELLFDLCFVVAVSSAANELHRFVADGHVGDGLIGYLTIFFAIWWAWMNFTWFASAYDTDDIRYRLLTFVQIAGVLVIAAGVPAAMDRQDFKAVTLGYVLLRLSMVVGRARAGQLRPARDRRDDRPDPLRTRLHNDLASGAHVRAYGRFRRDDPGDRVPGGARHDLRGAAPSSGRGGGGRGAGGTDPRGLVVAAGAIGSVAVANRGSGAGAVGANATMAAP